ncbi:MAG: MATE family efflux transporter [Firmicutes bacterium]|nr:MATE family efflux transporter [Bacillota bacterium]MDY6160195.1 MATE family efflux transporter [Candidatus Faecousia sp.]
MEMQSNQRQITQGPIWKQLLIFFFPILLGTFFQQMYNTVDTIIVGRVVGTTALAAVGATGPLVNMVNGFFIGISSGATVILSQYYGAGNRQGVHDALHTGVALSLVLGAMITVLGVGLGPWVMGLMNMPENCLADASIYLRIYFAGAIGSMVYNMGAGILRAMGDSRRPMVFLMATCVLNVVLDILFVAVLHMGVAGAALATTVAQFLSAALPIGVLLKLPEDRLEPRQLRIDRKLLGRILRIGVPAGLQFVTFDFSNILIQSGVNSFGDVTMAAWTAHGKTDAITWMISGAFGVSVTTFVGQNFGAQKYRRIRQSAWICLGMSVALVGAVAAVILCFRSQILGIYTDDPEVIAVGSVIMLSIMPFNIVFMPIEVFAGTMRGVGYSVVPTVITGCCVCLFRILWLATVVRRWHTLSMLTACYPISWIIAAGVFLTVYLRGNWLRSRIAQCGMEPEKT